jgi:hypothetical protein
MNPLPDREIEAVARELSKINWDGCEEDGYIEPCTAEYCQCRQAAQAAIRALDQVRGKNDG